ncbi:MAG TPA: hypothetical protein PKK99_12455, partial [Bacteroidia bacterium]|nr:hypothetical protein [Bacteroidia bacterium]
MRQLYPETLVRRKPPRNLVVGDDYLFGGPTYDRVIKASYLNYFKNVIVSKDGIILKYLLPQKEFITCYSDDFKHYRFRYILHVLLRYRKHQADSAKNYLLIFDNYSGPKGFAHWLSDGLTRLVELSDELSNFTVLVPYYFKSEPLYQQTLSYFNIADIEYIDKTCYYKVPNLFVANHIAESGNYVPENVRKLRDFIWRKSNIVLTKGFGEKIYI